MDTESEPGLRQKLRGWQILFIVLSGVIGVTILSSGGEALEIAGPGGVLLAYFIVGAIAVAVMEGVSEMIQLFPAPNAIVEYIRNFVDADLAFVVGISYWYTFAAIFATQIIAAAEFSSYWNLGNAWQIIIFYVVAPITLLLINCAGVEWFGFIETIGGSMKLVMVFGVAIYMYSLAASVDSGTQNIEDGFQNNEAYARNPAAAFCFATSIVSYGFLGLEMIAMTAYEARNVADLRRPSRVVAYLILLLYILCALGENFNIRWTDPNLPSIYGGSNRNGTETTVKNVRSHSLVVLAALYAGHHKTAGLLTGCLIFSTLSAANTALYIASRTMYGMTRELEKKPWPLSLLGQLGTTTPKTGVPGWALVISALSFIWLPYVHLKGGIAAQELVEIMTISGSVSGFIVWASLCLAFIRYCFWLSMHRRELANEEGGRYDRWNKQTSGSSTFLSYFQPAVAWLGLLGSLLVVFIFSTAQWWNGVTSASKVASAYTAPAVLLCLWVLRKTVFSTVKTHSIQTGLYVKLDEDPDALFRTLRRLYYKKPGRAERSRMLQRFCFQPFQRMWQGEDITPPGDVSQMAEDLSIERGRSHHSEPQAPKSMSSSSAAGTQNPPRYETNQLDSIISERP